MLRELAHVLLGLLAQLLRQLPDLLVGRAALQRFAQFLFGGAQFAERPRSVAILDLQRHRPKQIGDLHQILVRPRGLEGRLRRPQAEVDARRRVELLGRDHQRVERLGET